MVEKSTSQLGLGLGSGLELTPNPNVVDALLCLK